MARFSALPLAFVALLTGASLASGCSGCDKPADKAVDAAPTTSATPASSSAAVVASDAAPDAPSGGADDPGRRGMHRGPSTTFFQVARALELTPAQRQKVEAAEQLGASAGEGAARDAASDLHAELVAGIKAGQIDTAKLEPKYAALEKLAVTEHDKEAESLGALHAALDATQRKAVVASIRAKQAKRDERTARKEKEQGDGGAPDAGKAGRRNLDRLMRGIDLDAEQQKKIDALAPKAEVKGGGLDPAEMKKRIESLLNAFEKDTFDAKKADAFDVKKHRAALEDETKLLSQILPILKPEQREKLAAKMEKGPSPRGPKRSGHGHRPLVESEDDDFAP